MSTQKQSQRKPVFLIVPYVFADVQFAICGELKIIFLHIALQTLEFLYGLYVEV